MAQDRDIIPYTAGLIDGEGCIRLDKYPKKSPGHNIQYVLRVSVKMSNLQVLELMKEIWGGNIYVKKKVDGRKQQWDWVIQALRARNMLKLVYPHLIVKQRQCKVALDFKLQPTGKKISGYIMGKRENMYLKLRELKLNEPG